MDSPGSPRFDIFGFYMRYSDIVAGIWANVKASDEQLKAGYFKEELLELLEMVEEAKLHTRISLMEEIYRLMLQLDLKADFSEFSRFYDFVFFLCRENGQKNISVRKAVMAWRLILDGRFRLLHQWCDFVEKNQRHNISEDTWRQVLAFSHCVHENLEGYDPEGAWPVLIDEFAEHMYRIRGSDSSTQLACNCDDSDFHKAEEQVLRGLKLCPGFKRKSCDDLLKEHGDYAGPNFWEENRARVLDMGKYNNSNNLLGHSNCAVEGSLSKGFAGLLSNRPCLQFEKKGRVSFT